MFRAEDVFGELTNCVPPIVLADGAKVEVRVLGEQCGVAVEVPASIR